MGSNQNLKSNEEISGIFQKRRSKFENEFNKFEKKHR